jgi:hypothetical protein
MHMLALSSARTCLHGKNQGTCVIVLGQTAQMERPRHYMIDTARHRNLISAYVHNRGIVHVVTVDLVRIRLLTMQKHTDIS